MYGRVIEEIPKIVLSFWVMEYSSSFVDANLYHDLITGRAVTGILHLVNQTPIELYTRRQPTMETTTYGSEFMAARTATEQIMDLRLTCAILVYL